MKIIVAPDRFGELLSATAVAQAMGRGAVFAIPSDIPLTLVELPLSSGGPGLVDCLTVATYGRKIEMTVSGPLGDPVEVEWGILGDGQTAVIEAAAASGVGLLPVGGRPRTATSFGTGQLIAAALDRGMRRIIVGTGDCASLDGGIGMAQALGVHLRDAEGYEVGRGVQSLRQVAHIDLEKRHLRVGRTEIVVAADEACLLTGMYGAASASETRLGLTQQEAADAELGLRCLAERIERDLSVEISAMPGGGAGGGLAAGLVAFLGAKVRSAMELVLETVRFNDHLKGAALVLTGQERIEGTLPPGGVTAGVARAASAAAVPCIALVGNLAAEREPLRAAGLSEVHPLPGATAAAPDAELAAELIEKKTREIVERRVAEMR